MMSTWVHIATAIWLAAEMVAQIATIGRPRGPRTTAEAVTSALFFAWVAYLLVAAVI